MSTFTQSELDELKARSTAQNAALVVLVREKCAQALILLNQAAEEAQKMVEIFSPAVPNVKATATSLAGNASSIYQHNLSPALQQMESA